jgi:predicted Zn finger-like uncharacterized protein
MLIACPNCSTSYAIEPGYLGAAGRTVRCARCKTTWFADAQPAEVGAGDGEIGTPEPPESPGVIRPDRGMGHGGSNLEPAPEDMAGFDYPAVDPAGAAMPVAAAIADAPSLVPALEASEITAEAETDEIEDFAARRKRLQARRKQARRSSRWTAFILVLFAFNVALIGSRSEVVRIFPQTASLFSAIGLPVNLRNLKFENMRISKEAQEGVSSLVVEGAIVSISNKATEIPRLRFAARDSAGQEVYTWTALPSRSILGPGEKLDFRTRFASPSENAVDVMVRFSSAQDTAPGAK